MNTTNDLLNKAADIIERQGWVQNTYGPEPSGPHCVLGALNVAAGDDPVGLPSGAYPAAVTLLDHLGRTPEHDRPYDVAKAVADWNDENVRTRDNVVQALRETAEGLDE